MFDRLHLKTPAPVNDIQGHSRSLPLLPFDMPYTISYQSSIVSISLSCTIFLILTLICQKIKMSRDLDHGHLETVSHHTNNTSGLTRAQNLTILSSAIAEKFKECEILK